MVTVPWARPGSGFTLLFEAWLMLLLKAMPVASVADLVGEHDTRLWRLLHHHVDEGRAGVASPALCFAEGQTLALHDPNQIGEYGSRPERP